MARILHVLGLLALALTVIVFLLTMKSYVRSLTNTDLLQFGSSAAAEYRKEMSDMAPRARSVSTPLIVEAQAFAASLSSSRRTVEHTTTKSRSTRSENPISAVRPRASSVAFKLHGTSVYRDRPERSMALISEPGGSEGERKWVREGAALGHFVVEEIRRGVVVLSDGDTVREMTVEPSPGRRSLVRNVRSGSRAVSVALRDGTRRLIQSRPGGHEIGQNDRTVNNSD